MFRTKELEYFYYDILQIHREKKEAFEKLKHYFEDIDLSVYLENQETYRQSVKLLDKHEIYLTWNISDLIFYIKGKDKFEYFNTYDILTNPDMPFENPIYNSIATKVKEAIDSEKTFSHASDFIIIENIPFFAGASVIDGNHRIFDAAFRGVPEIKAYIVRDIKEAYKFLQPESQKLIKLLWDVNMIICGMRF